MNYILHQQDRLHIRIQSKKILPAAQFFAFKIFVIYPICMKPNAFVIFIIVGKTNVLWAGPFAELEAFVPARTKHNSNRSATHALQWPARNRDLKNTGGRLHDKSSAYYPPLQVTCS